MLNDWNVSAKLNTNDKKLNVKIVTSSFCIFFLEFTDSLFGWEVDYFILVTFFNGKVNVFEEYILKRFVFGITWNAAGVDFISLWTWAGRAESKWRGDLKYLFSNLCDAEYEEYLSHR